MARSVSLPPQDAWHCNQKVGGWWHAHGERVTCDLCPHGCSLAPGEQGICRVRRNLKGQLVLAAYGRVSVFDVDPIEQIPLHHFYPGSRVLSCGTVGCNLECAFCQAWELAQSRSMCSRLTHAASPRTVAEAAGKLGCRSVAFAWNEPVTGAEYVVDVARCCRRLGIKTVAVTAGYLNACARPTFFRDLDAVNVDLKGFSERFYRRVTGAHLQPVLETIEWIRHETEVWLEITALLIPGENDARDDIQRMASWIVEHVGPDVPLHFTPFHPAHRMRDRSSTPPATLIDAREIAMRCGLQHVYTRNVADPDRQSTFCPACGRLLIERDASRLQRYALCGSTCGHCGRRIAGHFADAQPQPGTEPSKWDARQLRSACETLGFRALGDAAAP